MRTDKDMTDIELRNIIIEKILIPSLIRLYEVDYFNICIGVSERNICARLAHHMENILQEIAVLKELSNWHFSQYYVDVEYNRMVNGGPKHFENSYHKLQYMISDLLVQSRGIYELQSLLAIEMKRQENYKNKREDKKRLESLVSESISDNINQPCVYGIKLGAFITYSPKILKVELYEDVNGHGENIGIIDFLCKSNDNQFVSLECINRSITT